MCQLMRPDSRGTLTLPDPDGPPRIAYHYLRTEHDRRRLRHAVRIAAELLRAGLGTRAEPGGDVLGSDRALDGWIAAHLDTAQHLCGTAPMGRADDPHAVVDPALWVHGLAGLRVADLSALPTAPRRGTAATACAMGEAAAEFAGAEFLDAGIAGARDSDAWIAERDGAGWAS
jgi:choline dehydrogenase-like flavoprotein